MEGEKIGHIAPIVFAIENGNIKQVQFSEIEFESFSKPRPSKTQQKEEESSPEPKRNLRLF